MGHSVAVHELDNGLENLGLSISDEEFEKESAVEGGGENVSPDDWFLWLDSEASKAEERRAEVRAAKQRQHELEEAEKGRGAVDEAVERKRIEVIFGEALQAKVLADQQKEQQRATASQRQAEVRQRLKCAMALAITAMETAQPADDEVLPSPDEVLAKYRRRQSTWAQKVEERRKTKT